MRLLLYEGQYDWEDGVAPNEDWLAALQWPFATELRATRRRRWTSDGVLLGWALSVANLTHAVVRAAGHLVAIDQPYANLDLMERWIERLPLHADRPGYLQAQALQATPSAVDCGSAHLVEVSNGGDMFPGVAGAGGSAASGRRPEGPRLHTVAAMVGVGCLLAVVLLAVRGTDAWQERRRRCVRAPPEQADAATHGGSRYRSYEPPGLLSPREEPSRQTGVRRAVTQ